MLSTLWINLIYMQPKWLTTTHKTRCAHNQTYQVVLIGTDVYYNSPFPEGPLNTGLI